MKRLPASFLPPIALDRKSKIAMYRQLYDWFRHAITSNQLRPGQRVPSTRNLATELKISRIPVLAAYEQLLAEGYLETFTGAGTCVAKSIRDEAARPPITKVGTTSLREARRKAPRRISRRVGLLGLQEQLWLNDLVAFRVSLPALDHFPAAVWSKLVIRHSRKPAREVLAYGNAMGYAPFREAIAEYLGAVRAVRCDPSQILVTTGSQQGLQLSAHVLLDPKDRAWMEEPGYLGARQAFTVAGTEIVPVPVDYEGLNVEEGTRRGR